MDESRARIEAQAQQLGELIRSGTGRAQGKKWLGEQRRLLVETFAALAPDAAVERQVLYRLERRLEAVLAELPAEGAVAPPLLGYFQMVRMRWHEALRLRAVQQSQAELGRSVAMADAWVARQETRIEAFIAVLQRTASSEEAIRRPGYGREMLPGMSSRHLVLRKKPT